MGDKVRIRRRQTIVFIAVLFVLGLSLIILSAAMNPAIELWSTPFWASVVRDVGFLFAPTAILTLLYESLAETKNTEEISDSVIKFLTAELDQRLGTDDVTDEIVALHKGRYAIDFNQYFESATDNIDILVTNLQTVQMYAGVLLAKAESGVNVRILALNPTHSFLSNRFPEIGLRAGEQFREEIISSLRSFCLARDTRLAPDQQLYFSLRLYNNPPTIMIFRRDDRLILAFILRQGRSRDQLHIEFLCTKGSGYSSLPAKHADAFVKHFETIWTESKNVTYDELQMLSSTSL